VEHLLEGHPTTGVVHTDALVEAPGRWCRARAYREAHPDDAAGAKLGEGVAEQRLAQAAPAAGGVDAETRHPRLVRVPAAEAHPREPATVLSEEPERRVEVGLMEQVGPALEGDGLIRLVARPGQVLQGVAGGRVATDVEGPDGDPLRPARRTRRVAELSLHLGVVVATRVSCGLEQTVGGAVPAARRLPHLDVAAAPFFGLFDGPALGRLAEHRTDAAPRARGVDLHVDERLERVGVPDDMLLPGPDRRLHRHASVLLEDEPGRIPVCEHIGVVGVRAPELLFVAGLTEGDDCGEVVAPRRAGREPFAHTPGAAEPDEEGDSEGSADGDGLAEGEVVAEGSTDGEPVGDGPTDGEVVGEGSGTIS